MPIRSTRLLALAVLACTLVAPAAYATDLNVMNSGGFTAAYKALKPTYELASGDHVDTAWGPSMGKSPEAIPNRLDRGEHADVVIMVGYALDGLIKAGKVRPDSKVDLADSRIGVVVRAGAPRPDVSTEAALRKTLLSAKSIAYSDSASGVYVENELFRKLGIQDQVKSKAHKVQKTPVGETVANGEYEIGLQQVAELLPVAGVDFVGKIPESVQSVTRFSAGIPVGAAHPADARKLIEYMAMPQLAPVLLTTGLDPIAH
jgi:molybdate transport system substrate-binding protein